MERLNNSCLKVCFFLSTKAEVNSCYDFTILFINVFSVLTVFLMRPIVGGVRNVLLKFRTFLL